MVKNCSLCNNSFECTENSSCWCNQYKKLERNNIIKESNCFACLEIKI